jgi:hypothetical protein
MRRARDPDAPVKTHGTSAPQGRGTDPLGRSCEPRATAVCETVFRYQLQQPLVDPPQPLRYYLALRGRDPDQALLGQLRELIPRVQPLSHCRVSGRDGVVDRVTGVRGVILQVARLTWRHVTAAEVVGGYYLTHRQAASFRYYLESHDSRWAVTAAHLLWRV